MSLNYNDTIIINYTLDCNYTRLRNDNLGMLKLTKNKSRPLKEEKKGVENGSTNRFVTSSMETICDGKAAT